MGQINLYKIDINKHEDFFENLNEKFECIGTQEYQLIDNEKTVYEVGTYFNMPNTKHNLAVHLTGQDAGNQKPHRAEPDGQQPEPGKGGVQQEGEQ